MKKYHNSNVLSEYRKTVKFGTYYEFFTLEQRAPVYIQLAKRQGVAWWMKLKKLLIECHGQEKVDKLLVRMEEIRKESLK